MTDPEELDTSKETSFLIGNETEDFGLTYEADYFLLTSTSVFSPTHLTNATLFPATFNQQRPDPSFQSPAYGEISWFPPGPYGETVARKPQASDEEIVTYEALG